MGQYSQKTFSAFGENYQFPRITITLSMFRKKKIKLSIKLRNNYKIIRNKLNKSIN